MDGPPNTSDITGSGQVYGPARQTLIVTSSPNNHGDQWDIRAAIDPNDIDQTTKIMQAYHYVVSSTAWSWFLVAENRSQHRKEEQQKDVLWYGTSAPGIVSALFFTVTFLVVLLCFYTVLEGPSAEHATHTTATI